MPRRAVRMLGMFSAIALASASVAVAQPPAVPDGASATTAIDDGDPRVRVALVSDHDAVEPGQTFQVGVLFQLDPEWHVYFRNPGEAAVGTEVELRSERASFGPIGWPIPERLVDPSGLITTFGYEGEVLLGAEARAAADASGEVRVEATADFLVCRVDCIPGRVELHRTLAVGAPQPAAEEERRRIAATRAALPRTPEEAGARVDFVLEQRALRPGDRARAAFSVVTCAGPAAEGDRCLRPSAPEAGASSAFFPDRTPGVSIAVKAVRPHPSAYAGAVIDLELEAGPDDPGADQIVSGLLSLQTDDGPLALEVRGELPRARASEARALVSSPLFAEAAPASEARAEESDPLPSLWAMLLLALLGGVILNAMPCVLPVLALKAFSLARVAGEGRAARLAHTGGYTGGILLSMWALAATVVGLRAAGMEVGWGFQLQEPVFATVLSAILVVLALGLFGVFEIGVDATRLASRVDGASGLSRSLGEGVLTVVLATPCSAPFLGTAVGFAFASDAPTIVAVFTAVGLGLAAPFAAISLVPGARRLVPKPGAWMHALQQLLGFVLLGTAVWLTWIVGNVTGVDGMARTLAFLVLTAGGTWAFVTARRGSAWARRLLPAVALLAIVLGGAWVIRESTERPAGGAPQASAWSESAVQAHLAEGRPVFVDFTAAWCITCKVNERLVVQSKRVQRAFADANVAVLVGDWTERDERIRAELARYGKAGVPLYLMFSPSAPNEPEVLPELLTEALVLDAVARAEGGTR